MGPGVIDMKWRKDTTLRVGPLRVQVMGNEDGLCSCLVVFDGEHALIGNHQMVREEVLDRLAEAAEGYVLQ